jgi:hypothetical protein
MTPNPLSDDEFVRAVLTRTISHDDFHANAQRFVSTGRWLTMSRELQREVKRWIRFGLVKFNPPQQGN